MNLLTANRLQQLRKMNGYSQEVLAEKLGISRQSISKWERAEASPEIDNLMALAKIYGITVDELLDTSNDKVVVANTNKKDRDIKGKLKSLLSKANDFGIYPNVAKALLIFPFPIILVILYIALSMIFDIWHPLWIVFLTLPMYYRFAIACKANNKKVFMLLMPVPEFIVTVFLLLGILTGAWGYACILFIIIPLYYWLAMFIKSK
ncbi:MAG TPA: helix-turn-helix transcriptional regulator [Candidatus Eubacterium faecigallinarum]|nr:helix-turn-helix transcriptional regulator [Candidatus Eubacterium faecigallinarum]